MLTDLTYTSDSLFTRFFPITKAGEDAWREMAKEDGNAAILNHHAQSAISQLRAAGYSVSKAKKPAPVTDAEIDELLSALTA